MISLLKRKMGISTDMRKGPDTAAERPAGSAAAAKSKRQKRNNAPRRNGTEGLQKTGFAMNRHGNQPTGVTAHTLGPSRPRSEEHTSELQSLMRISYAVFCLKKKTNTTQNTHNINKIFIKETHKQDK